MALPTGETIGILADNLRLRNSVLPIPKRSATRWARGLGIPRGGETIIYTGMMYQLIPYIEAVNKFQEIIEDTWLVNFIKVGRLVNRLVNISAFMGRPSKSLQTDYNNILANIARLLTRAGVEFGYLYEDELYSGALIYDLGMDDVLALHAQKVYAVFKKFGVKNLITVDPHTTNMLRSVYPSLITGYNLQVKSYLQVLVDRDIKPQNNLGLEVAIHDSCVYARYENILNEQRTLLNNAGITVKEPPGSGIYTHCCGGPVESLFPKKAKQQAGERVEQIASVARNGVTMCPICFINLKKAAGGELKLDDISNYLFQAYC